MGRLARAARRRLRPRTRVRAWTEARRENHTARRYAAWRQAPVRQGTVLYEAFFGNGMLDNPEAVFRYLLDQPDLQHLHHIWVLDDLDKHPRPVAEFAGNHRVRFVELHSLEYLEALATSQYLISNSTFPQHFSKRPGQIYVNTWHGVPLKHMGFDMPRGGVTSRNITRNFLHADYLVSANPFMTDAIYRKAYRLQGIYRGAVIEEGQPRTDRQVEALKDPQSVLGLLERAGVTVGGRKVVLYAPTWRGENFMDPLLNVSELLETVRTLQRRLGEEFVVLLKAHQVVYDALRARARKARFLVPNEIPTNLVLGVTDALVTDYSSIFFDFVATGRPVVHHVPDLDDYRDGRGLYLTTDQLPGPVVQTVDAAAAEILAGLAGPGRSQQSEAVASRFAAKDDGRVCERLVDVVFRGADESEYVVHRDFAVDKERILIYLGSLKPNGITTSALNLLRHLDYDRYDVTAFWAFSNGRDRLRNAHLIDERVRVLPRVVQFNGAPHRVREEIRRTLEVGLGPTLTSDHREFWGEEWTRIFGHAKFDHLVDFSGYGCVAAFLFSVVEGSTRSIWLHNDMAADMERETVGHRHLENRLQSVFSTYRYFDHLVSVSPALERINRERLTHYARPQQFRSAFNTIDADRILRMAGRHDMEPEGQPVLASFDTSNVAAAVSALMEHFSAPDIVRQAQSLQQIKRLGLTDSTTLFVTVGRLSPEKNHERLIRGFAQVHAEHPEARLVILGGGPLQEHLHQLIVDLGLEAFVSLPGQVDNPFLILADADCFVLSSDYEGQPMVILEARTLGLPIVTTAFASVEDSVPPNAGLVVPRTPEGIADGMRSLLAGEVPAQTLDPVAYNREAVRQFYAAIGARQVSPGHPRFDGANSRSGVSL
jgi:CDP-glycerol glycerophosphotransferase (TagB/SpsB family)/glycosyltransferase involved in cell wall biosynthesis